MSERVYKRKDGKYEARYVKSRDRDGKIRYGTVYGNTREEAIARRADKLGQNLNDASRESRMNILILGAGSYGREVKEVLEKIRIFNRIDFLDDSLTGDEIKGRCEEAEFFRVTYPCAFVAIGDNEIRKRYAEMLIKAKFLVPTIISPDAIVSPNAKIGIGTMIFAQGNVSACEIGDFCLVQANGMVNAECKIEDYSRLDNNAVVLKGEAVPESTWIKPGEIYGVIK